MGAGQMLATEGIVDIATVNCTRPMVYVPQDTFHDRFALGKLLGKGSQGSVYCCIDRETRMELAVKVVECGYGRSAISVCEREIELCRACRHSRNVMQVMESFIEPDKCYVVLEKFEGHLRNGLKWVAKHYSDEDYQNGCGGVTDVVLRRLLHQALSGVVHMHRSGIIHRDIKAHNLLVDRLDLRDAGCRLVVSDLGLARRLSTGRFLSAQVGTRKYWAPEMYEKRYWHVVDIFAIGVVMFLAATGRYPYHDEWQTRQRDIFAERLVPIYLSEAAEDFLQSCLIKDPCLRPTGEDQLLHPWLYGGSSSPDGSTTAQARWRDLHAFGPNVNSRRCAMPDPQLYSCSPNCSSIDLCRYAKVQPLQRELSLGTPLHEDSIIVPVKQLMPYIQTSNGVSCESVVRCPKLSMSLPTFAEKTSCTLTMSFLSSPSHSPRSSSLAAVLLDEDHPRPSQVSQSKPTLDEQVAPGMEKGCGVTDTAHDTGIPYVVQSLSTANTKSSTCLDISTGMQSPRAYPIWSTHPDVFPCERVPRRPAPSLQMHSYFAVPETGL